MRHRVAGKQLSRTTSHRKALRRNMASSLIQHGAIRTTVAKAKELRPFIERLITTARQGTLHARRRILAELGDRKMFDDEGSDLGQTVVQKLFGEVAPRYADRPGGYTRIIRLEERRIGDAGEQVILQLVEESIGQSGDEKAKSSRRRRRAARRHEAVGSVVESEAVETNAPAEQEGASDQAESEEQDKQ